MTSSAAQLKGYVSWSKKVSGPNYSSIGIEIGQEFWLDDTGANRAATLQGVKDACELALSDAPQPQHPVPPPPPYTTTANPPPAPKPTGAPAPTLREAAFERLDWQESTFGGQWVPQDKAPQWAKDLITEKGHQGPKGVKLLTVGNIEYGLTSKKHLTRKEL